MAKILVTGGAGYKGVMLSKALLEAGHEVTVFDNFLFGYSSALCLTHFPNCTIRHKDIRSLERRDLANFEVVYHLAALSGFPACQANPHAAREINASASIRLASLLDDEQLLVFASTTSLYGRSDGNPLNEDSPVNPTSLYAETKLEAEQEILQRKNSISLRFATIFGASAKMRTDLLINDFVYKAVTERSVVIYDGDSVRTFLHISDAVSAYLLALHEREKMVGKIFNVGHESLNYSKFEIGKAIEKHTDLEVTRSKLGDLDARSFVLEFDRLGSLGFEAETSLDSGVKELVKLYRWYQPTRRFPSV